MVYLGAGRKRSQHFCIPIDCRYFFRQFQDRADVAFIAYIINGTFTLQQYIKQAAYKIRQRTITSNLRPWTIDSYPVIIQRLLHKICEAPS